MNCVLLNQFQVENKDTVKMSPSLSLVLVFLLLTLNRFSITQLTFTCSKSAIETLQKVVKYGKS